MGQFISSVRCSNPQVEEIAHVCLIPYIHAINTAALTPAGHSVVLLFETDR